MTPPNQSAQPLKTLEFPLDAGGHTVTWLLCVARPIISKSSGDPMTVVELRDPCNLTASITAFVPGETPQVDETKLPAVCTIRFSELRSGKARSELVGTTTRAALDEALKPVLV